MKLCTALYSLRIQDTNKVEAVTFSVHNPHKEIKCERHYYKPTSCFFPPANER